MVYSITWDETKPDDNNYGYEIDNYIRSVLTAVRERLATEHSDLTGSGGLATLMHKWAVTAKSTGSPYTVLATDHLLLITTGASDYTLNLPTAVGITGKMYKIKKVDSGAGTVIIDGSTTETIDGALTKVLYYQNEFIDVVSDGANWVVVAQSHSSDDDVPVGTIEPTARRTPATRRLFCTGAAVSRTTYSDLKDVIMPSLGTVTMTIASPCVVSLTGHGFQAGDTFFFTTTGTLPLGISADTLYYVISTGLGADSFQFSETEGGAAVNSSGAQNGEHTLYACPWGLGDGSTTFNLPDFRGRFPFGRAASGTGSGLGRAFGTIDHVHTLSGNYSANLPAGETPTLATVNSTSTQNPPGRVCNWQIKY